MRYFEFPHCSRMFCLHLNISEKLHLQHLFEKLIAFVFLNMIKHQHILKNNINHSKKRGPPQCFHLHTNPALCRVLIYSVNKAHVLVATVGLFWLFFLNLLSCNFVPLLNKSLRFTRFTRIFSNHPVVILTNHCQSCNAFLPDVHCSKRPRSLFAAVCSKW